MLAPSPTPSLEGNPLSAARDCLLNTPSVTRGRVMLWWHVTQYFRRCWKNGFSCELCRRRKQAVSSTNWLVPWSDREKITITNLFEDTSRFSSECKSDATGLDVVCPFSCLLDTGLWRLMWSGMLFSSVFESVKISCSWNLVLSSNMYVSYVIFT